MKNKKIIITDKETVKLAQTAVKIELEKRKAMNAPIAIYDSKTGVIYAQYNDGKKEVIGSRTKGGRLSERKDS